MTVDPGNVGHFALCEAVGRETVVARTYVTAIHHFRREYGGKGGGAVMLAEHSVLIAGALPFFFVASSFMPQQWPPRRALWYRAGAQCGGWWSCFAARFSP